MTYFILGFLVSAIPLLIAHERNLRDSEATKQLAYRTLERTQREALAAQMDAQHQWRRAECAERRLRAGVSGRN